MIRLKTEKEKSQPTKIKTSGSTFKNPISQTDKKVWELIKQSVPLDISFGDACISKKHCNFFINKGKATFKDMKNLIDFVAENVLKKTGQELEWRIELKNEKVIVARTSPSFFSGSWGEQITIILNGNKILINSICDTRKRDSLISAGRNTKNMNTIIKNIKKPVTNNI